MSEEKKAIDSPKITGIDAEAIRNSEIEINQTVGEIVGGNKLTIINYYYAERVISPPVETEQAKSDKIDLPSPYRGLYHFGPDDAAIFFGRELFTRRLVELIQKQNFIAVLGASGSGKSSVVLAGLVPALAQAGPWKFTHFRPSEGDDPFHALATALVPLYIPHLNETEQMAQARQLAGFFREKTLPLTDVITKIRANHPQGRVLLIADQFEELYTLYPDETLRQQFLDSLIQSLNPSPPDTSHRQAAASPLVLVLTMRADFLGQVLTYRPFADVLQDNNLMLGPMNREELAEAIVKPAESTGVTFEAGLVERILDDVENQPGSLPLLQFALTSLWNKRAGSHLTHSAYTAIGQVSGSLTSYAEEVFATLSEAEQQQARRSFVQLVQPGEGTGDTRRIALKAEVGADNWPLVERLADARLVVTSRNVAGEETVEVVHEALIRAWERLQGWIEADRAFLIWQKRLRFSLEQWLLSHCDEDSLLRGVLLAEAEGFLSTRKGDLMPTEHEFIQASVTLRDQERQREKEFRETKKRQKLFSVSLIPSLIVGGIIGLLIAIVFPQVQNVSRATIVAVVAILFWLGFLRYFLSRN